jgi:hypothetical protein
MPSSLLQASDARIIWLSQSRLFTMEILSRRSFLAIIAGIVVLWAITSAEAITPEKYGRNVGSLSTSEIEDQLQVLLSSLQKSAYGPA